MKILSNYKMIIGAGAIGVISSCSMYKDNSYIQSVAKEQALQDSLYYRTIFNTTSAANDSSAIAEFNNVAANMRNLTKNSRTALSQEILNNAQKIGITKKQTNIIKGIQYISNTLTIKSKQNLSDSFVYEKIFEKYGISDRLK